MENVTEKQKYERIYWIKIIYKNICIKLYRKYFHPHKIFSNEPFFTDKHRLYTQALFYTGIFTHRCFKMQRILFIDAFTYNYFKQRLLHTDAFITDALPHRHFCTRDTFKHTFFYLQILLHTDTFTHRHFYRQKLLHTNTFTDKYFYTQTFLPTESSIHRDFLKQTLLYTGAFTNRSFYTWTLWHTEATLWHTNAFTHTQKLLHTDTFTHKSF